MLQDLGAHLNHAVRDVFGTMLNYELEPVPGNVWLRNEPHMAGCVGFTGEVDGVVYIYASEHFARRMASRLLRMDEKHLNDESMVCDAMGEITNMVAGPIKSRFSDHGIGCVLTIPAIVRGSDFKIETVGSTHRRYFAYRCPDGELAAEVVIRRHTPKLSPFYAHENINH
jgi:chemotaxis protein CheX